MTTQTAGVQRSDFLDAIVDSLKEQAPEQAVKLIYHIFLGRDPDESGLAYYSSRYREGWEQQRAVIQELARSDEAQQFGVFSAFESYDLSDAAYSPKVMAIIMMAALGKANRRAFDGANKLLEIEEVARLTLLMVPEWCGSAYKKVEARLQVLEGKLSTII